MSNNNVVRAVEAGAAVTAPMSINKGVHAMNTNNGVNNTTNETVNIINTINLNANHWAVKRDNTPDQILNAVIAAQKAEQPVPKWAKNFALRTLRVKRAVNLVDAQAEHSPDIETPLAQRKIVEAKNSDSLVSDRTRYQHAEDCVSDEQVAEAIKVACYQSVQEALLYSIKGKPTELFRPLLLGQEIRGWVRNLAHMQLENKAGNTYSALYGATVMSNSAISAVNRRMYAGYLVDLFNHEQFEEWATKTQDIVSTAASAIAAHGNRDSATHGSAVMELRVKARDQAVEGHEGNRLVELQEQMHELAKDARPSDAALAVELIEEFKQLVALRDMSDGRSAHSEDTSDSTPRDLGWTQASVSSFNHLYSFPVTEVAGLEAEMSRALWYGKGLHIPTLHRDLMDERLSVAYATALEYTPTDQYKVEKRAAFFMDNIEGSVNAVNKQGEGYTQNLAGYARWAINSFTRRLWRDKQMLVLAQQQYTLKLDQLHDAIRIEEEDDESLVPKRLTRVNMGETQELGYTIRLPFIDEVGDEDLDPEGTQGERLTQLYTLLLTKINEVLPKVEAMYTEYRALDEEHTTIWTLMASDDLPISAPPVYWNNRGWYMTEQEAQEALMDEIAERITSAKDASADAIADTLEAALASIGSLI